MFNIFNYYYCCCCCRRRHHYHQRQVLSHISRAVLMAAVVLPFSLSTLSLLPVGTYSYTNLGMHVLLVFE
jgi:hypothetical protein